MRVGFCNKLWFPCACFAIGSIFTVMVGSWQEVSVFYRVIYVVLFIGLLLSATWSKQKTNDGDNDSDNNPLNASVCEPSHKSSNNTAKSQY